MLIEKFPSRLVLRDKVKKRGTVSPDDLLIREARQYDLAFVVDSWFQSAHVGFPFRNVRSDEYQVYMPRMIERLLTRSQVHVAVERSAEKEIISWACVERLTDGGSDEVCVHYCYTAQVFRNHGLQHHLLKSFGLKDDTAVWFSHPNEISIIVGPRYRFRCNHFLAFMDRTPQEQSNGIL